jgi:ubiquinone/menaquinone biosynthesis C-methylase UbiE
MKWTRSEIDRLSPILERLSSDLVPVDGKQILVLSSAAGEVAFRLAEMMESGKVIGMELDPEALEISRRATHEIGLSSMVEFLPAEMDQLPIIDSSFDAVVSESIVYPTAMRTKVGLQEMARVLAPGGKLALTDVISTRPLPVDIRHALSLIGLDYLLEATHTDLRSKLVDAGLVNVELVDQTSSVRMVWESRREMDLSVSHEQGYAYLLDDLKYKLGKSIFYLYIRGEVPNPFPQSKIRLV